MEPKDKHQPKMIKAILVGITGAIMVIIIFEAGVFVGYKKAAYSYQLGDNYYRAFRAERPMLAVDGDDLPGGHGAAGKIVKVELPLIVVADEDNVEKTVLIGSTTVIKQYADTLSAADLKSDEYAVVLGSPNQDSEIVAKFIRIVPPPQEEATDTNAQ